MERKDSSFSSGEGTTYAQAVVATSTGAIARDGTRERAKLGRSSWETWVNHEARVTWGTIHRVLRDHLCSENRIYVFHRGMRDVQAAFANGGGIRVVET